MKFSAAQLGVIWGMALAIVVTLAGLAAVIGFEPATGLGLSVGYGERLAFALTWDIAIFAVLAVTIGAIAQHRFFTPADIDGSGLTGGTPQVKVLQSVLQNTLEQSVLAVGAHLAWAVSAPEEWLGWLPLSAGLFVLGRILFWRGYARGAAARAFGFAVTFYPSVLTVAVAAGLQLANAIA